MRALHSVAVLLVLASTSMQLGRGASPPPGMLAVPAPAGPLTLPEAPEKAVVLAHCQVCHGLEWIERSGGTEKGWNDRLKRMIRSGATIPRDQLPTVAAYLARALPVRLREPPPAAHENHGALP